MTRYEYSHVNAAADVLGGDREELPPKVWGLEGAGCQLGAAWALKGGSGWSWGATGVLKRRGWSWVLQRLFFCLSEPSVLRCVLAWKF